MCYSLLIFDPLRDFASYLFIDTNTYSFSYSSFVYTSKSILHQFIVLHQQLFVISSKFPLIRNKHLIANHEKCEQISTQLSIRLQSLSSPATVVDVYFPFQLVNATNMDNLLSKFRDWFVPNNPSNESDPLHVDNGALLTK